LDNGDLLLKRFLKLLFGFIFPVHGRREQRHQPAGPSGRLRSPAIPGLGPRCTTPISGFVTYFCWVAWRERALVSKIAWFILIKLLGNIVMSFYVDLLQLVALKPDEVLSALFRQKVA
jgi:hypothetical protein